VAALRWKLEKKLVITDPIAIESTVFLKNIRFFENHIVRRSGYFGNP
jgi:hypothetical protein